MTESMSCVEVGIQQPMVACSPAVDSLTGARPVVQRCITLQRFLRPVLPNNSKSEVNNTSGNLAKSSIAH